jgi:Fic family protein
MAVYFDTYDLSRFTGASKLIAIAAGHHRLMCIHPFLDGNGRVARLLSGALIKLSGVSGYGLWSVNRGFGWQKERYLQQLARADARRQGDLDGRGNLSQKALDKFCRFFLETCLDQARYMGSLLEIPGLLDRIRFYINQIF